jgi:pimeloyl-ACP methyl ester carboxylesterase
MVFVCIKENILLMKNLKIIILFLFLLALCPTHATTYTMLTPLDTANLPNISMSSVGDGMVRNYFSTDLLWKTSHKILLRNNFSASSVNRLLGALNKITNKHMVSISCTYWSKDSHGDSLLVSGKIYLPKERNLRGIIIANHYTIASDKEAPSNFYQMDCIFAMKGYAVIMPDYVGYGISRNHIHPYLHWRSAAQTAIDLLDCIPQLLDKYGYTYPTDIIVTGYSQGAAVALGVVRLIEEQIQNNLQQQSFNWSIRKLYAGAGPYDPAVTYKYCVEKDSMGIPGAIPMIIMGLSDAYELNLNLDDFLTDSLAPHCYEWIMSKELTVDQISLMMGANKMSMLMKPQALAFSNALSEQLYTVLKENSNVGYDLKASAYFFHSLEDDMVPFVNSEALSRHLSANENITFDFGYYGSHKEGALLFMQHVYKDLK